MKTWIKYEAIVCPAQKVIKVNKITFDSNNPKYVKKNRVVTLEKEIPLAIDIPLEEYETTIEHFDSSAFQSDDRFFSTTQIGKRYNLEIMNKLRLEALKGYNIEAIELTKQIQL